MLNVKCWPAGLLLGLLFALAACSSSHYLVVACDGPDDELGAPEIPRRGLGSMSISLDEFNTRLLGQQCRLEFEGSRAFRAVAVSVRPDSVTWKKFADPHRHGAATKELVGITILTGNRSAGAGFLKGALIGFTCGALLGAIQPEDDSIMKLTRTQTAMFLGVPGALIGGIVGTITGAGDGDEHYLIRLEDSGATSAPD